MILARTSRLCAVNTLLHSKKRLISLLILLLLAVGIPTGVYLSQQQQNIRPNAATAADLVIESFELTDAGGNTKTTFYTDEDIYVRITIKNTGGATATSQDGSTYSVFYANRSTSVPFNDTSTTSLTLKNGQFSAGYSSQNSSIYGSSTQGRFSQATSWRRSTAGTYTAQVLINQNKFATESNYNNNYAFITYTVTNPPAALGAKTYTAAPSGFDSATCTEPTTQLVTGLRGCVMDKQVNGKTYGRITNTGSTTRKVGMAIYKAYLPYPNPYPDTCPATDASCTSKYNWIWTQTPTSWVTSDLAPSKTMYFEVTAPSCAWQSDVFTGNVLNSFTPPTRFYSGENRYLDGYYNTTLSVCQPTILTPTPTVPVPTVTTGTTPTPTLPEETPSPTPSACPIPPKVTNVRVVCPYCKEGQI